MDLRKINPQTIKEETWFAWYQYVQMEGDATPRLVVPWSDPHKHEFPADFLFKSPGEAREWKKENASNENWILVRKILQPVAIVLGEDSDE